MTRPPFARSAAIAVGLVALVAAGPVLARIAPDLVSPTGWFAFALAASFAAMALSLDVVAGHAGQLTLGHGAVVSIGAVASGVATAKWNLPFAAGALAGAVAGFVVSWLFARPAVRLGALSLGAVTLAVAIAAEVSLFRWDWITAGREGMVLPRPLAGSFRFSAAHDYAAIAVAAAAAMWLVDRRVGRTRFGRSLHVIRDDERVAQALGIDPIREKQRAFALAGTMAGLAGSVYGHLLITIGADTFGFSRLSLPLLTLVVIAGQGSAGAVALVGAAYGLLPRVIDPLEEWIPVVSAALFLNAVARNPEGIASTVRGRRRRRRDIDPPPSPRLARAISGSRAQQSKQLVVAGITVEVAERLLLDQVSLTVAPRSIVALVGANGAGKTTLMNAVSGFIEVDDGSIKVGDSSVLGRPAHDRRRLGIARMFQGGSLPGRIDVEEALLLFQTGTEDERRRSACELAAALGFAQRLDTPVRELSVGQQRMVELAGVLSSDAEILLLDEPSAGLAPPLVEELAAYLQVVRDDAGCAVLLVEHNMTLVRAVADRVVVLDRGRVVQDSSAEAFFSRRSDEVLAWLGGAPA